MIARVTSIVRRLTRIEQFLLLWLAVSPAILLIALFMFTVADAPGAGLGVLVAYYFVALGCAGIAAVVRLRQRRTPPEEQPPTVVAPIELGQRSLLADDPAPWAEIESPRLERLRVVRRLAGLSRGALLFFGMRTKAEWIREPLTYLLSGGRLDYLTLERLLLTEIEDEYSALMLANIDYNLLLTLSRLVKSQDLRPGDNEFSLAVLSYVAARPEARVSQGNRLYLAERLILAGQLEMAYPLVNQLGGSGFTQQLLRADLLNPFHASKLQNSRELWLTGFNAIYQPFGVEPVSLKESGVTPYDCLEAPTDSVVTDGPLISVIMTCYRPDHTLASAVNSMIAQTWQNWELLIADDCSPDEYQKLIDEVAASDARIRVLRTSENRGTYIRRNEAIVASRGELVTMHDSDDWAHPRRLELQARHLLANPAEIANLSYSLRVSEELMFVQPRGATLRLTESSLLFHKKRALEKVGYFDSVRRAADSEYRLRLEAAFKREVPVVDTLSPLALVRYGATSLSGSDLGDGWMHPARLAYRSAGDLWRNQIRDGNASPYVAYPLVKRPFPAPDAVIGNLPSRHELDLVMALDARTDAHPEGHLDTIAAEIRSLLNSGLQVGILQIESLVEGRPPATLSPMIQVMINENLVSPVLLADETHASTVVVRNASVLQGAPGDPSALSCDRVLVFEDRRSGRDIRGHNFARSAAEASAARLFGSPAEWVIWDSAVNYDSLREGTSTEFAVVETHLGREFQS